MKKHVVKEVEIPIVDEDGVQVGVRFEMVGEDVEMGAEEEAEFLASLPASPKFVPETISDRQFYQMLALTGKITQDEALAAVQVGAIPAALQPYIDALADPLAQFNAKMLLSGAIEFRRHHPLAEAIGQAQKLSAAEMDQFWIGASQL